jgi:hypothetical protein
LLLAFLFAVSLHVLLTQVVPGLRFDVNLGVCAAAIGIAVLVEQVTLVLAGRDRRAATPAGSP